MKSAIATCPICKSMSTRNVHRGDPIKGDFSFSFSPEKNKTLPVYRCAVCSHQFCWPLPDDFVSNYTDVVDMEYLRHSESRMMSAERIFSYLKPYVHGGRLLDIGCATGDFILVAKNHNFLAEGLEMCAWSSFIAEGKGIQVFRGGVEEAKFNKEFDVVLLIGVIEHFEDPLEKMKKINRFLRPGGIVVIWTGDVDGFWSKLLGRKWWYWQGQHIQYFTKRSLGLALTLSGFDEIEALRYPFAANRITIGNSLSRYAFGKIMSFFLRPLFWFKKSFYLKLDGEMLLVARKSRRLVSEGGAEIGGGSVSKRLHFEEKGGSGKWLE